MSEQIRCFLAIALPDQLKQQLTEYIQSLKQFVPHIRWTKTENLHLTLKFLGEQPSEKLDQLIANTISAYSDLGPITLSTGIFGGFPNQRKARVIWLGVESNPEDSITRLHTRIEQSLEPLGFLRESKTFTAHLTLGRNRERKKCQSLWPFIKDNPFQSFQFTAHQIFLMRSILNKSGPKYSILQKFSLQ